MDLVRFLRRGLWLLVLVPLAPLWTMGWLRDDWLLLWEANDPASAPAGAQGVFFRPVASATWWVAAQAGDSALEVMHALTAIAWVILAIALLRIARHFDVAGAFAAIVVVLWTASHAALAEPRLWSAASNGVWAAAFGAWGARLLVRAGRRVSPWLGMSLLAIGILARADAVLWSMVPIVLRWTEFSTARRWGSAAAGVVIGGVLLLWMSASSGGLSFAPAVGGELLRRMVVPWGPPLSSPVAGALGVVGAAGLAAMGTWFLSRRVLIAVVCWVVLATVSAASVAGWSAAGRYAMAGIAMTGILVAAVSDGPRSSAVRGGFRLLVVAVLGLHLASSLLGATTRDLRARSRHEMALQTALREHDVPGDTIVLVDPPSAGWNAAPADFENVASATLRRHVRVVFGGMAGEPDDRSTQHFRFDGQRFVRIDDSGGD